MTDPTYSYSEDNPFVLGTRGSPLAMRQAEEVRDRLVTAYPNLPVEIRRIKVGGDQVLDRALSEVGGKGMFTKELDNALLAGQCTAAVHSMKDMETILEPSIAISAVLPREDVRDAWLSPHADGPDRLEKGSRIGTASLRRQAQLLHRRPDLKVVLFRGNVQTRLRKLSEGVAEATMLAMAGLNRLNMVEEARAVAIEPDVFLPAVAQGAIAIAAREDDADARTILAPLNDQESSVRVTCERAFLEVLDGSCRTPIAGLAECKANGTLHFRGLVAREDGTKLLRVEESGSVDDPEALGKEAGRRLKVEMGNDFFF